MKKLLVLLLAFALVFSFAACADKSSEDAPIEESTVEDDIDHITLVMSAQFSTGGAFDQEVLPVINKKLAEKTNGGLSIDYYGASTLIPAAEQLDAVASGVTDISACATAAFSSRLPVTYLIEYPAKYVTCSAASYAAKWFLDDVQPTEYADIGVTPLMIYCTGDSGFALKGHALKTMTDFADLKIRGNAMMVEMINAWGGSGIALSASDIYQSMNSGTINGCVMGTPGISDVAADELCEYYTRNQVFNSSFVFVVNNDSLAGLPEEWQTALMDTFDETFEEIAAFYNEKLSDATYTTLQERGIAIDELDEATVIEMETIAQARAAEYSATLDAKGLDGTAALAKLAEYREKANAEYTTSYCEWWNDNKAQ